MNVIIKKSVAMGKVAAPPSKSMAHRLLICAGFSKGESIVSGISLSEDIKATAHCLEALGSKCRYEDGNMYVTGGDLNPSGEELFCNESGSTLRFFVPVALTTGRRLTFRGSEKLLSRPLDEYEKICKENGFEFIKDKNTLTVCGNLKAGEYTLRGDISSQYITGLLFALSLLEGDSIIHITPPVESRSYIELTLLAMREFGVNACFKDEYTLFVPGNCNYTSLNTKVEGDYSNAAFLEAFNLLGGNVTVLGLSEESLQGDRVYIPMYQKLREGTPRLDLSDCPDLAPVLFTMAAYLNGGVFTGTKRLRIKESDRATVMALELSKFGADIKVYEDSVEIKKTNLCKPEKLLSGHNDHRVVMSLALLCSVFGGEIEGAEAVKKSFPDFFHKIEKLGIDVTTV